MAYAHMYMAHNQLDCTTCSLCQQVQILVQLHFSENILPLVWVSQQDICYYRVDTSAFDFVDLDFVDVPVWFYCQVEFLSVVGPLYPLMQQ